MATTILRRIDTMMALIGPDHPALWATVRTLHDGGDQNAHMQSWSQALRRRVAWWARLTVVVQSYR